MVFQSFNLFPHRTVLQNVTEGPIHVLGLDRDEAETRALALLRVQRAGVGAGRCGCAVPVSHRTRGSP